MSGSPSELGKFAFELGKVLLKVELSKRASAKLIRSLGGTEKETVLLQKIGKYWNQENVLDRPDGLIIITNYRLVFLSKVKTMLTRTDFLSFPFQFIKNIEATKVMFVTPAIRFQAEGKLFMFTFFSNAEEVLKAVGNATKT